MDDGWLLDDEAVLDKLPHVLPCSAGKKALCQGTPTTPCAHKANERSTEKRLCVTQVTKPSSGAAWALHSLELAIELSLTSLGSSHTLRRPHLRTEAASLHSSTRIASVARRQPQNSCFHNELRAHSSKLLGEGNSLLTASAVLGTPLVRWSGPGGKGGLGSLAA